jgi:hypothetical protein
MTLIDIFVNAVTVVLVMNDVLVLMFTGVQRLLVLQMCKARITHV